MKRTGRVTLFCFSILATFGLACGSGNGESNGSNPDTDQPTTTAGNSTATSGSGPFEQVGLVKEWDPRTQTDPSKAYTTSFKTSDQEIDVVFKLRQSAEVTTAWKYQGKWVLLPGSLKRQTAAGEWGSFSFTWADGTNSFDAGDYEVILTVAGVTETKALKFSIAPVSSSARFSQVGLTKQWTPGVAPNPSTFATAFLPQDQRVNAVSQLTAAGEVTATWKYGGHVLDFGEQPKITLASGVWGTQYMTAAPFPTGEYEVMLALAGSSETRSLKFTVGTGTATKPRIEQVGLVARQPVPGATGDPSTFVTTFKPTDQNVYAVFKLSTGDAWVWVTGTWKYQGAVIMAAAATGVVQAGTWQPASLSVGSGLPVGDYEFVLSMPGSEETRSLKFTVR